MTGSLIEWAIIAFITLGIAYAVWKGGAANPVGTGGLQRTVNQIASRLQGMEDRSASKEDLTRIEAALQVEKDKIDKVVGQFEGLVATITELRQDWGARNQAVAALAESVRVLDSRMDQVAETVAGMREGQRGIERNLDRIYNAVVEKGMSR